MKFALVETTIMLRLEKMVTGIHFKYFTNNLGYLGYPRKSRKQNPQTSED